tara:strand:- start:22817 stop:24142 length:1326 start_codon:yes stop_codon:yes gene_type:complete
MKKYYIVYTLLLSVFISFGQTIDRVEAIIGDEILLSSEIETQYLQYLSQGNVESLSIKCEIIEDLLFQKLLVNQANVDSVEISDEEVRSEINKRINYFESQLGSVSKVENYFGKSIVEIKNELTEIVKDQFLAQRVQSSISNDISITPSEVRSFFRKLPAEEIPEIPTKLELIQIIINPIISQAQKDKLRERLNIFRDRVYNGEDFQMLATLYSDDPVSASKGGELGFVNRGDLVPEFERAAFRLRQGEISEVIESKFGFHIIQLIERRGDQINVRHILLRPKVSATSLNDAKVKIEKIADEIKSGSITFEEAILKYSDDDSKNSGGVLIDQKTMSNMHIIEDMDPSLKFLVKDLDESEFSSPNIFSNSDETNAYRLIKVKSKLNAHKANLSDDFSMIKEFALNIKRQDELFEWIKRTVDTTYIEINSNILSCNFKNKWIK